MAILSSEDNLSVEIRFDDFCNDWVNYRFYFSVPGAPLFNPKLRKEEYFFANEYEEDSLIPELEEALRHDHRACWSPTEPDLEIEIVAHPKQGLKETLDDLNNKRIIYVSEAEKERLRKVDEERERLGGKLPDDYFELTFLVDTCQIADAVPGVEKGVYTGDYLAMRMGVTRQILEQFVEDLKREYAEFCRRHEEAIKRMRESRS